MKKIFLPVMTLLLFASCHKENEEGITVCHTNPKTGISQVIKISLNEWPAHQAQGDVRLDDQDRDGYVPNNACGLGSMGDCEDKNPAINPGATEICENGIDENCNGQIDETCITPVTICNQVWMSKNLEVSNYRNGDVIPQVTDDLEWAGLTTGAWCYYENNTTNGTTYGKLYNWYAVNDARGLAPAGWHIPSFAEWTSLVDCLGGEGVAGGKMKETGTTHWQIPNTGATNSSSFTGLPGGNRGSNGPFHAIGDYGYWWSSTEFDTANAWLGFLYYSNANAGGLAISKTSGFSVRCVRD